MTTSVTIRPRLGAPPAEMAADLNALLSTLSEISILDLDFRYEELAATSDSHGGL